jgi:hypothetical protein
MNNRRSFIWKLGAGASAALAATAGMAKAGAPAADSAALRVAQLEAEQALRQLHQSFQQAMDQGLHEQVIDLFAADAVVVFNGGIFNQRSQGVSRLYREHFRSGRTGGSMEPAPGFELTPDQRRDSVEVAPDLQSAQALFTYSIKVGMPFETDSSLASMARLQGEGVRTWWEGGLYRGTYRKEAADGNWKISRLEYDTLSRADWRSGRSYARPIAASCFSTRFPADQQGPDALV